MLTFDREVAYGLEAVKCNYWSIPQFSPRVSYTFYPVAYRIVGLLFENVCPELLGGIVLGKWNVRNRLAHEPT